MTGPAKILTALAGAILAVGASSVAVGADYPQEWAGMDAAGLASLAEQFKAQGAPAADQRKLLAEYVASKHLTDDAAAQGIRPADWYTFAESLGPDLTPLKKEQWRKRLRSAFSAREMSCDDLMAMRWLLSMLGDGFINMFTADWTRDQQSWKSWSVGDLVKLGQGLGWGQPCEAEVIQGRQRVAAHVQATYLADAAAARAVSCEQWESLAKFVGASLDADSRKTWVSRLKEAFAPSSEALVALSLEDMSRLSNAVAVLGDRQQGSDMAVAWLGAHGSQAFQQAATESLVSATGALAVVSTDPEKAARFMSSLEAGLAARASENPLRFEDYRDIMTAWLAAGNADKAQEWGMKTYQAFLGSPQARDAIDLDTLVNVSLLMNMAGVTGADKGYVGCAEAIARLAREGKLDRKEEWAYALRPPLRTEQTRQIVQAELLDQQGELRSGVAKVLAWVYRDAGKLDEWRSLLDGRIADEAVGGDARARWLLARAYVESIAEAFIPYRRLALSGKEWLDQAVVAAESPALRLEAVAELARGYAAQGMHNEGLALLASLKDQFEKTEAAEDCKLLLAEIEADQPQYVARMAQHQADHDRRIAEARRKELGRRLARARTRGDARVAARLESLLSRAQ